MAANIFIRADQDPGTQYGYIMIRPEGSTIPLFSLHGIGERGDGKAQLSYLERNGLPKINKTGLYDQPTIAAFCPQQPTSGDKFYRETLYQFMQRITVKYGLQSKVHLAGLSMGAYSSTLFMENLAFMQEKFKNSGPKIEILSVLLIAGTGSSTKGELYLPAKLKTVHGLEDTVTSPTFSKGLVDDYNRANPAQPATFEPIPYLRHENAVWDSVYRSSSTYKWMLS